MSDYTFASFAFLHKLYIFIQKIIYITYYVFII